jgi:membrane-associated phospholipid phosphatase
VSRPRGGWRVDALLVGGFVLVTLFIWFDRFDYWDLVVRDWSDANRTDHTLFLVCRAVIQLGSARLLLVVAVAVAALVAWRSRSWRPVLPVVATAAVSYLVVGPMKVLTHRAAPHSPLADGSQFFTDPVGWSYPSGHVVNTLIWYPVLVLLLTRLVRLTPEVRAWVRWVPVVTVGPAMIFLGYHWMTDVLGALLIGGALDRLLRRVPWPLSVPAEPLVGAHHDAR